MKNRRTAFFLVLLVTFALVLTWGCATKKFVRQEVENINSKVDAVGNEVEANQTRLRGHDEKLATIGELIAQQDAQLKAVSAKVDETEILARGHLLSKEIVRSGDAKFGFDSFELTPEATAAIDAFVQKLVAENKGVYLEIQGHTDSTGSPEYNLALGRRRADAMRDYLYKHYHIPLHRMSVISLGSLQPLADNSAREGRAQNRRIEILVFG